MERDYGQSASRREHIDGLVHRLSHRAELVIDRDADRLEAALGRMLLFAPRLGGHGVLDEIDQFKCRLDRFLRPPPLDRGRNQGGVSLLAIRE